MNVDVNVNGGLNRGKWKGAGGKESWSEESQIFGKSLRKGAEEGKGKGEGLELPIGDPGDPGAAVGSHSSGVSMVRESKLMEKPSGR